MWLDNFKIFGEFTFIFPLFLSDIHEFYENVLTNERIPVGDKVRNYLLIK